MEDSFDADVEEDSLDVDLNAEESHSCDKDTVETSDSASNPVVSILDRLRSPQPLDLARKRKVRHNPPPRGLKKGKQTANPKNVSPSDRVKEFPGEHFTVSNTNAAVNDMPHQP